MPEQKFNKGDLIVPVIDLFESDIINSENECICKVISYETPVLMRVEVVEIARGLEHFKNTKFVMFEKQFKLYMLPNKKLKDRLLKKNGE